MNFRDIALGTRVAFRLRPTLDLRHPRDTFRYQRRVEQRKVLAKELLPLNDGPLAPEVEKPRDLFDDDKDSALRDEWRAEANEWLQEFREECRDL